MPRFALGLEYDGAAFSGWQSQAHAHGVQEAVEHALTKVANHPVAALAAGRTDAGVHALMQVIHFDSDSVRSERGWVIGANTYLPPQVSALWSRPVPEAFHARYSAFARRYRYVILNRTPRPALAAARVCWIRDPLDTDRMQSAAGLLIGEHDFTSFRAAECQARTPMRHMHEISVERSGELIIVSVLANAFLHHMVRNIVGVLLAVGSGERPENWVAEVLAARDRRKAGITAPASGLYLAGVRYSSNLGLPSEPEAILPAACPVNADQV